ncbi:MAG: DUF2007 domain-containing protein [Myxococcota bacterium]|nr:DUF2007 domain-containing protein [Myxococcota bacterium]
MPNDDVVVFSSLNLANVHLVRSVLTREGVPSRMKAQMLGPLAGEVPMDAARAELYVAKHLANRALSIIAEAQAQDGPDRICPNCGETNPPSFELCWQCEAPIPDTTQSGT